MEGFKTRREANRTWCIAAAGLLAAALLAAGCSSRHEARHVEPDEDTVYVGYPGGKVVVDDDRVLVVAPGVRIVVPK